MTTSNRKPARHKPPTPRAPAHLDVATRRWWVQVCADFVLEPHHLRLLTLAGETWDTNVKAEAALREHGLTHTDRYGQARARPEVAVARDAKVTFARLMRELQLDVAPPEESRLPRRPGTGS
jgi:phage terminase small subunit